MSIESIMPSTISSSVTSSSSFPASGSFPMSQLFASCGQSTGASASASVLPTNIQSWFPLGLTGLISLLSKRLSGVFSSTEFWKLRYCLNKHSCSNPRWTCLRLNCTLCRVLLWWVLVQHFRPRKYFSISILLPLASFSPFSKRHDEECLLDTQYLLPCSF